MGLKKGQIYEGIVTRVDFPNKGIVKLEDGQTVTVKNVLQGQKVTVAVQKVRKGKGEGRLVEVLAPAAEELAEPLCKHFGECGGCTYQNLPYEKQLELKEGQVRALLRPVLDRSECCDESADMIGVTRVTVGQQKPLEEVWEGIKASPEQFGYRNKMEFSFGDLYKDGPLALGMHKRGSFYDIAEVPECQIVDEDYRKILCATVDYFREAGCSFFHKLRHTGYLRHLLVRKGKRTGEILIDLVTTTQVDCVGESADKAKYEEKLLKDYADLIAELKLQGKLVGILHTKNDRVADIIADEGTDILFGRDFLYEEILGLRFKISAFSFFQTNSLGAEVLYETARDYIGKLDVDGKPSQVVFDLYSGTGTIAQMIAPVAKKVIGVEIIEEAVEAAKVNAGLNGLENCDFIAGDVLKVLDTIEERPDYIILDPPRDGIHPKALEKIINYGVDKMVYISCKPTSLARDLEVLLARGYRVERVGCVDMFPGTAHVETVVLLSKQNQ